MLPAIPVPLREPTALILFSFAGGLALFAGARFVERAFGISGAFAALFEEASKTAFLILSVLVLGGSRAGGGAAGSVPPPAWSFGRALSAGLAGIAVFVAAENAAYAIAFPDSGTFLRLAWSLPLHLSCALGEALAIMAFARGRRRIGPIAATLAAWAIHPAINVAVSAGPAPSALAAGSVALTISALILSFAWFTSTASGGIPDASR